MNNNCYKDKILNNKSEFNWVKMQIQAAYILYNVSINNKHTW